MICATARVPISMGLVVVAEDERLLVAADHALGAEPPLHAPHHVPYATRIEKAADTSVHSVLSDGACRIRLSHVNDRFTRPPKYARPPLATNNRCVEALEVPHNVATYSTRTSREVGKGGGGSLSCWKLVVSSHDNMMPQLWGQTLADTSVPPDWPGFPSQT